MTGAAPPRGFVPWDVAWHEALYGPDGWYRRGTGSPTQHFRTSVHASPLMARAVARLARWAGTTRVVDVGSGRGELLATLADVAPELELVGVDVVERPASLVASARWRRAAGGTDLADEVVEDLRDALVVAHEWLDDVPCPVLEVDDRGRWRQVEVQPGTGEERLGDAATDQQLAWVERWWPGKSPGLRAEVGLPRDRAWARLVGSSAGSTLLAVDYSHHRLSRPAVGSLTGYRDGHAVPAVPDGSCDITAHVALDAVAAAGEAAGAVSTCLTTQRDALSSLGVTAERPDPASATTDPVAYLTALQRAGEAAELLDPAGLGSFGWLLQRSAGDAPAARHGVPTADGLDTEATGSPG